ncbi:MAG: cytidine deaminase [Anaeroplasmataceae bacterium]|nr:cytidine deaminase [Anaeroplasmataceae bacterium]
MDTNKRSELIEMAQQARNMAYAPYSKFKVGASILLKNGSYIKGCNVENVSYGLCNCAERTALFKMVSEGFTKDDVEAMCIIANTELPVSPCGACRQVMAELLNKDTLVVLATTSKKFKETTVKELLPYAFEEIENAD